MNSHNRYPIRDPKDGTFLGWTLEDIDEEILEEMGIKPNRVITAEQAEEIEAIEEILNKYGFTLYINQDPIIYYEYVDLEKVNGPVHKWYTIMRNKKVPMSKTPSVLEQTLYNIKDTIPRYIYFENTDMIPVVLNIKDIDNEKFYNKDSNDKEDPTYIQGWNFNHNIDNKTRFDDILVGPAVEPSYKIMNSNRVSNSVSQEPRFKKKSKRKSSLKKKSLKRKSSLKRKFK